MGGAPRRRLGRSAEAQAPSDKAGLVSVGVLPALGQLDHLEFGDLGNKLAQLAELQEESPPGPLVALEVRQPSAGLPGPDPQG